MITKSQDIVYIIPPQGYENERFFDLTDKKFNRDNSQLVFVQLRDFLQEKGYMLTTLKKKSSKAVCVITCNIPNPKLKKGKWKRKNAYSLSEITKLAKTKPVIAFLFEPITVLPYCYDKKNHTYFTRIYLMNDSWIDNQKYYKFCYPQPVLKMIDDIIPFEEKEFATLIAANKKPLNDSQELYSERIKVIEFYEMLYPKEFFFYGKSWNPNLHLCYRGQIDTKTTILKNFKFCYCFENTHSTDGYITEKIFDCFIAGCIPIYWGSSNIEKYVPEDCFIDRRKYKNNQELYDFLKQMSSNKYQKYIQAIQKFLENDQAKLFSNQSFINKVFDAIQATKF